MLEKVSGIEAEFWMNLRMKYDVDMARKKVRHSIDTAKISQTKKKQLRARIAA